MTLKNQPDPLAPIRSNADLVTAQPHPSRGASAGRGTAAEGRIDLAVRYALALHEYLAGHHLALGRAAEIGRKALADGLGVLELATAHSRALVAQSPRAPDEERARIFDESERFLLQALSPFATTHQRFWHTDMTVHRLLEGQAKRIAFALHNEAAQLLASVHFALAAIANRLPAEHAREIQAARAMLDDAEAGLRQLAHELRPPILEDLGLVPALELLADGISKRKGLCVAVKASVHRDVPAAVETTLYRIVQEALTNVAKHANATRAWVCVHVRARTIACSIRDDGSGFDARALRAGQRQRGLGLLEIEERVAALGGVLHLCGNTPRGTQLAIRIPLDRHS
jgi:signal transduction histidine kinase